MVFDFLKKQEIEFSPFDLLEFRTITLDDRVDNQFGAWSRIYEYPVVLDMIDKYAQRKDIHIHNTSWGFDGCHITFKNILESKYSQITNSDIQESNEENTMVWNITQSPPQKFIGSFDIVLNVSTVEEVKFNHLVIFKNLFDQVKNGGLLIITFDLPGLQLKKFEQLFNKKLSTADNNINRLNSQNPTPKYKHLNCGLIVLRKE